MENYDNIEKRIRIIEERNQKVENDKAWEISRARKIFISVYTYAIVGLFLRLIDAPRPWINAIIPVLGFVISTFTLSLGKALWLKYRSK